MGKSIRTEAIIVLFENQIYLYDMTKKKSGVMLFFGILFVITIPQILQMKLTHRFLSWLLQKLNTYCGFEVSSASISNALTIASLGLVLFSLSNKNQIIKIITEDNKRLNETVDKQEDWNIRFEQINQLDDLGEKINALDDIIGREKDQLILSRAYAMRGSAYYKKEDWESAINNFNKAIELRPDYAVAYNNRGNVYYKKEDWDNALNDYNNAIQLKNDYAIAFNNRGNVYYKKEDWESALNDYNKAIEIKPDYANAYYNRGNAFYKMQFLESALHDYNKAIDFKQDYALAYNNRGITYSDMGKLEEALTDLNKAVAFDKKLAEKLAPRIMSIEKLLEAAAGKED